MNGLHGRAVTSERRSSAAKAFSSHRSVVSDDEASSELRRSVRGLAWHLGGAAVTERTKVFDDHWLEHASSTRDKPVDTGLRSQALQSRPRSADWVRRGFDLSWSVPLAIVLAPAWLLVAISWALGRQPLRSSDCYGRNQVRFRRLDVDTLQIVGGTFLRYARVDELLGLTVNVLRGDLTLVGPRPLTVQETRPDESLFRARCAVTPGLICLWWVRRRTNMADQSEWLADEEYLRQRGLWHDLGILVRAGIASLYGRSQPRGGKGSVVGIPFDNLSMAQAVTRICDAVQWPGLTRVAFINADCVNLASKNAAYREALQTADYVFADGIGIKIAGQLVGCPIKENVNGTDLFPRLCGALAGTGIRLFLLGGRPGVAERVRDWIESHTPGVTVCGLRHGYYSASEQDDVIREMDRCRAEIVLVAFGAPKQELWIRDVLSRSQVRVAIGVGGLFDFYSGRIPRAPLWIREMGLEWTYRLYQEPRRLWRRYVIGNVAFLMRVVVHRLRYGRDTICLSSVPFPFEVEQS